MEGKTRVLLADDNRVFCQSLKEYFDMLDDFEVCGIALNGEDALTLVQETEPDVLILDIVMPKRDGIGVLEAMNEMKLQKFPHVVILSGLGQDDMTQQAMELGARYYMTVSYTHLEDRMLLWGEVRRNDKVVMSSIAQNDVIINHGSISRIIDINVLIDHQLALSFSGDGLVLATPTGSTAYSLSAGGPIVLPNAQMIVVTPISPHNLYARPMIANADSEIQVICNFLNKKAQVTFDGQNLFLLQHGDEVIIKKSPYSACFVWIESSMFFTNLHRKLCSGI